MDDDEMLGDKFANYEPNREERMPVILVVDGSAEMQCDGAIDCLRQGVSRFIEAIRDDADAFETVELKIVRFGGDVEEVSAWTKIDEAIAPHIEARGDRPLGAAMALAMRLVEERVNHLKAADIRVRRPAVVLATGGLPSDAHWQDVAHAARTKQSEGKFFLWPVSLTEVAGEAGHSDALARFHKTGQCIESTFADLVAGKGLNAAEMLYRRSGVGTVGYCGGDDVWDIFSLASFDAAESPSLPQCTTEDLINNREERWPCLIVVDASESMVESGAAEALEQAIGYFSRVLKHDPVASAKVQIQVVSYGDTIESAVGWSDAMYFTPSSSPVQRSTRTGLAMRRAMRLAAEQVEHLKSHHIDHRQPIIYLFSDGLPADEDWQDAARAVREGEAAGAFTVRPVSLVVDQGETVHTEALRRFSGDGRCDEVPVGGIGAYFGKVVLPPLASVAFSCPDDGSVTDVFGLVGLSGVEEPAERPIMESEDTQVFALKDFSDAEWAIIEDQVDYIDNREERLPCVLVLDASGSMNRDRAIDRLNKSIANLVEGLKSDPVMAFKIQLKVIRMGGTVDDLGPWTDAADFDAPVLRAGGNTPTGEAVELAMLAIREQREVLRSRDIDCRRPWIWLISDGLPTDANWQEVARRAREAQEAGECHFYPVSVITDPGDTTHTRALQSFHKNNKCLQIQSAELEACFDFGDEWQSAEADATAEKRDVADTEFVEQATGRGLDFDRNERIGTDYLSTVYPHPRDSASCVKIYASTAAAEAEAGKLQAMLARPPAAIRSSSGVTQIIWPTSAVLRYGKFAGFVMPRIDSDLWSFASLDSPLARRQQGLPESLRFRLLALHNLAQLLESLHAREHFAVDLDPRSIRVHRWSPDSHSPHAGHVVLSGCEGFSIAGPPGSRHRFHTKTILEDYCCPHLIDPVTLKFDVGRVAGFEREQDMWSFALIAFRMLNHGLRPWDTRAKSHVRNPPGGKFARIVALNRNYAYGRNPNPDFEALASSRQMWFDPQLLDLFERTFRSARPQPTLDEWIDVLRRLLHSSHRCEANTDHWKLGAACGECAVRTRSA